MTREIAHFQMFSEALTAIQPNFPPGVLQGDPRYTHTFFNMSNGPSGDGPWNHGQGPWADGESWVFIDDPVRHVIETNGLTQEKVGGTIRTDDQAEAAERSLGQLRSKEVRSAVPGGENQWSAYPQKTLESPSRIR
jgi:Mn-containing catalase